MQSYHPEIERQMQQFYHSLSEKDRRRYAAIEARKLGHGGIQYVCRLFECNYRTITHGLRELNDEHALYQANIRKSGGGRPTAFVAYENLDTIFLQVLDAHTAGSPMDETVKWTNMTRQAIADAMCEAGIPISVTVVDQLLEKHHFHRRKAVKTRATRNNNQRDAQFENIATIRAESIADGNPVLSMDVKKKEFIGDLYREGTLLTQEAIAVYDHDFPTLAEGVAIPHGLYDVVQNIGYITLGTSHDTSAFASDCIIYWWEQYGCHQYPHATEIVLQCDGGGSNSARTYLFKMMLEHAAQTIGLPIRIAHYPPYTSKYNPIEHRLFPHVSRACRGIIFRSIDMVRWFMGKTTTRTGLRVHVNIIDTVYKTGKKVADTYKEAMRIVFDDYLPQWNYTALPEKCL